MKSYRPHFYLSKAQRNALLLLAILLILLPFIFHQFSRQTTTELNENQMEAYQSWIDSIKQKKPKDEAKIFPFNPNYLTDYRAYSIGLSTRSIDRLTAFRKEGKYMQTASDFKRVSGINDSLFMLLKPFLKFPNRSKTFKKEVVKPLKYDINNCKASDLARVYGIGETFSARILKYRKFLGGFCSLDQLYEVYGLDSTVVERIGELFEVKTLPELKKVDLSNASVSDLEKIPYLNQEEAKKIIRLRTKNRHIQKEQLHEIEDFDSLKISRINLYLY